MAFSSFFSSKKKVLKVVVQEKPSQEIRFAERDPIDKVIDKIKAKFELTDEETVGFNIQVSLRGVWATPDQTIGDLLLRNNDEILFAKQPNHQQPLSQQRAQSPNNTHHSVPGGKLYPQAGDDWVMVTEGGGGGGVGGERAHLNTDPCGTQLRHSVSDGNLYMNNLAADPKIEFLSKKTYISTGKVTLKFPSRVEPSLLQIPPEISLLVAKEQPQVSSYFEAQVIEKINQETIDNEQQEAEHARYRTLKKKIRDDLQADAERAQIEANRKEQQKGEEERKKKEERETKAITSAPDGLRGQIIQNAQKRQCYLDLYLEKKVGAEVAAMAACKFSMMEANRSVFLHLVAMQIPMNVSELVAEDKTNLEEALNVAFSLCPLVEKNPDLSAQEIQKVFCAHSTVPGIELQAFMNSYKQMKGMGFGCEHVISAIVQHPRDPSAALELLITTAP